MNDRDSGFAASHLPPRIDSIAGSADGSWQIAVEEYGPRKAREDAVIKAKVAKHMSPLELQRAQRREKTRKEAQETRERAKREQIKRQKDLQYAAWEESVKKHTRHAEEQKIACEAAKRASERREKETHERARQAQEARKAAERARERERKERGPRNFPASMKIEVYEMQGRRCARCHDRVPLDMGLS